MKKTLTILLLAISIACFGKNYYVSNGGNNSSDGLTTATAWQTIPKVNTMFSAIVGGDSILFKCGDTFFGNLVISKSGVSGKPIVISSYGAGAKPLFTGFTTLSSWTSLGGNIYRAPLPAGKNNLNLVTVDNRPVAVGRFPNANASNAGYFTVDAFNGKTSITDATLPSGSTDWTGAEMILMPKNWWTERCYISSHSGNVVTYRPAVPPFNLSAVGPYNPNTGQGYNLVAPDIGRGYFIQRDPRTLDQDTEWYFDTTGVSGVKQLRMYFAPSTTPADHIIRASILDTIFSFNTSVYITIANIAIEGANQMGLCSKDANNISVINCDFINMGSRAMLFWNIGSLLVDGCTGTNILSVFIDAVSAHKTGLIIRNCHTTNVSPYNGMCEAWNDGDGKNMYTWAEFSTLIEKNFLDTMGGAGIQWQGSDVLIQNNFVNYYGYNQDDEGGIYTYEPGTIFNPAHTNRVVKNNIVLNGIGVPIGEKDINGLYSDGAGGNILYINNTVAYCASEAMYTNNAYNVTFRGNTVFNSGHVYGIARYSYNNSTPTTFIKQNIGVSTEKTGGIINYYNGGIHNPVVNRTIRDWMQNSMGENDSNYYHIRYAAPFKYRYFHHADGVTPPPDTLYFSTSPLLSGNGWLNYTGNKDIHSSFLPVVKPYTLVGLSGANGITNPTFDASITGTTVSGSGAVGSFDGPPGQIAGAGSLKIVFPASTGSLLFTNVTTGIGAVDNTKSYILSFASKATSGFGGYARIWLKSNTGTILSDTQFVSFETSVITHELNFNPTVSAGTAQVVMQFEQGSGTFYLDNFVFSQATVTFTDYSTKVIFRYNASSIPVAVSFSGRRKTDPKGAIYDNGVILQPWTSIILFDQGASPSSNQNPISNPGADKSIQLPTNTVTLDGTGSSDPDGTIDFWLWSFVSGPGGSNFGTSTASTTTFNNLTAGDYDVQLKVTDNLGATNTKIVHIHVAAAPINQDPIARAGTDIILTLPTNSTGLNGSASSDPEGGSLTFGWSQFSGPSTATITNGTIATPTVSNLIQGVYLFKLTVTDPLGATSVDYVQVTINAAIPPPNTPPVARAGADQQIQLPANSVALDGTASTDSDGTIDFWRWDVVGNTPSAGIFSNASFPTTTLSGLVPGNYLVRLWTKDNAGDTSVDYLNVRVLAAVNQPPVARAGADDHIQLPVNSVNLSAVASSDPEGDAMSFIWTQKSGPSTGVFGSATSVNTTFGSLIPGLYVVQVKVTAAGDTSVATKQVIVDSAAVNNPPAIQTSTPDTVIVLPGNSLSLSVTAIDGDGSVAGYRWSHETGPAGSIIVSPDSSSTSITGLSAGTHTFKIVITDNRGATAFRIITITVQTAPTGLDGFYLRGYDADH